MAYDTITSVTDDLNDNLASYQNEKKTAIDKLMSAAAYSSYVRTQSMTGNVTLTNSDFPIQSFSPTAARDLTLPAVAATNHAFYVINRGSYEITVKNAGATVIGRVESNGTAFILSDGANGWYVLSSTPRSLGVIPGGRLTLTSGTPVTTSDVTGATSIYYSPLRHNKIELWSGTHWNLIDFSETTLAVGTVTSGLPYDVFAYLSSGVLALEKLAWTNGTTRATAITLQDGRYCKSGDKTRLYLGSFYSTSTSATEDSNAKRFLFNMYNRVGRKLKLVDTTNSWTYSTATWRAWDNSNANRVEVFLGVVDDLLDVSFNGLGSNSAGYSFGFGLGLDSTSANSADTYTSGGSSGAIVYGQARYVGYASVGYHYFQALEMGGASGTTTFYGDSSVSYLQAGLIGDMQA
ncbi:MAG: hypothetical protein E6R03_17350 [Hyphomicrobiaceae bacterium]|nr:MAG: hypothetical protein E6R03_17350 [Hyphomicrobiaceae bacterium]